MGLMEEKEFIEKNGIANNRIEIRLHPNHMIQPDIKIFPLFCQSCKKVQPGFYVHCGSRYGQVGSTKCQYCEVNIDVTDGDNLVDYIKVNGRVISFRELYLLDWSFIQQLGHNKEQLIENALAEYKGKYMTVNQLCSVVANAMNVNEYPVYTYSTDVDFSVLPKDINQWSSLLTALGVVLPEYVKRQI